MKRDLNKGTTSIEKRERDSRIVVAEGRRRRANQRRKISNTEKKRWGIMGFGMNFGSDLKLRELGWTCGS